MYKILMPLITLALVSSSSVFAGGADEERLASTLASQSEDIQARYGYRHPQETLEFFGIAPGMTVVDMRDEMPDDWADGSKGYLKQGFLIAKMEAAGFEFVAASDINTNEKDQPAETDIVWRLPPSFATSRDNPELKAEMTAIGESNRMTLKFRKPK